MSNDMWDFSQSHERREVDQGSERATDAGPPADTSAVFTIGDRDDTPRTLRAGGPPLMILAAAAASATGAIVILLVSRGIAAASVAWFLSGPIAIVLYGLYLTRDTQARALPTYGYPTWLRTATSATLVLAGIGILASAWFIARWVGMR